MTYCLALLLDDGLVFASDSRSSAGVDYVTTYRKVHVFAPDPDRLFVILSAGNLGNTQEIMDTLRRDIDDPEAPESLASARYLFEAAQYVGRVSLAVQGTHSAALAAAGEVTLILGGQIHGQAHAVYLVYPQGNYVMATPETPFLQIGESKYGKPVLDRIMHCGLPLEDGARLALVSLDATRGSNITVGPPFDVALYPRDSLAISRQLTLDMDTPEYRAIRDAWHDGLRQLFRELPRFEWETPAAARDCEPQMNADRSDRVHRTSQDSQD